MAQRPLPWLISAGLGIALVLLPSCPPPAVAAGPDPRPSTSGDTDLEAALLAESPLLDTADRRRLEARQPVVHMDPPGPVAAGTGWRILDAPAERLYRAVADLGHYAEFFPFVLSSTVTADDGGRAVVQQRIDLPFPWPDRRFAATTEAGVETTAAGRSWRVSWNLVPGSGNVEASRGEWRLRELAPERTLVALHLVSDAGAVPTAVQRRALERTLPWALDGLRQQVNRCRYDVPVAATCAEAPPRPAVEPATKGEPATAGEPGAVVEPDTVAEAATVVASPPTGGGLTAAMAVAPERR